MAEWETISVLTLVSCFASVICGVVLLATQYKMAILQYTLRNLKSFLTIADIITSTGYIAGTIHYIYVRKERHSWNSTNVFCEAQSFVTTFSNLSSFAWMSIIAVHLYIMVKTTTDWGQNTRLKVVYHVIGWAIPAVVAVVMLVTGHLGESYGKTTGPWCWVKLNHTSEIQSYDTMIMFLSGKAWEILTYILTLGVFRHLMIYRCIEKQRKRTGIHGWSQKVNPGSPRPEDERFFYIWLPLLLCRVWGTVRFFMAIPNSKHPETSPIDFLLYMQCIGDGSLAMGNFILFCVLDKDIRAAYLSACGQKSLNMDKEKHYIPTVSVPYQSIGSSSYWEPMK